LNVHTPLPRSLRWIALVMLVGCADADGLPDVARDVRVARPVFDSAAAHRLLVHQVEFGPRVPGTEGHRRQLEWMLDYLAPRADTVVEQRFAYTTSGGVTLALTNVMARFRPDLPQRILLLAHWDTRPTADADPDRAARERPILGANDGASGTAVLLQLAEMFRGQPPPVGVDLLFVDGEDYGPGVEDMFLGARFFAANLAGYRAMYGVLLDMVADRDPRFPIEGYSAQYAPEIARRVWTVARDLGYADVFPDRVGQPVLDDHVPLNRAGLPTINIIDFEYGPGNRYWHTHQDVPENTSASTLGIVGEVVAELVYRGG
jgi:glutaminyl-peptide cyclotransferase